MRSTTNAASLGDYLSADEDLKAPKSNASPRAVGAYLADVGNRRIAGASQIHGAAAAKLGLGGRELSLERFASMLEGRHVETGEQVTRSRSAPVYERDASGRVLRDERGQKVRALDDNGKPKLSRDNELLGVEIITEHGPSIRCLLVAAEAAGATDEVERIKDALAQVNQDFLAYVEENIPLVRRTIPASMQRSTPETVAMEASGTTAVLTKPQTKRQGSKTVYVTGELAMVAVPQWTARANVETDQRPSTMPDPAPHTHNIIAPVAYLPGLDDDSVFGSQEGRFGKIDEYQLLKRSGELSAVHDAMTHIAITALGYETEKVTDFATDRNGRQRWRVKGINPLAEEFFSSNSRRLPSVVADWEAKTGRVASPAMRDLLMQGTKGAKHKAQDSKPDWSRWVQDTEAAGIEVASLELRGKLMNPSERGVQFASYDERVKELRARLDSENGLHREQATFSALEARATLMRASEGLNFYPNELEMLYAEIMSDPRAVIALNPRTPEGTPQDPEKVVYSSPQMLNAEERVGAVMRQKARATHSAVSQATADRVLAANKHLDAEQRQVYSAITAGRGLVMIEGPAGTGKTSTIKPAIDALVADERINQVVVVSTASRTADETGAKLGAKLRGSIESITERIAAGKLKIDDKTLVVIDEAAMVDTRRMETIVSNLGSAQWVMAGDPHQMQPIGPGGWYQDAQRAHPEAIHQLSEVHRHIDPADTAAYNALREGRGEKYIDSLAERKRLFVDRTEQASWDRITKDYARALGAGFSAHEVRIVAAGGSNKELDNWNRAVQKMRIERGEISPGGFEMIDTATNRSWKLHSGDVVMVIRSHQTEDGTWIKNGMAGIARKVDPRTGNALIELHNGKMKTEKLAHRQEGQTVVPAYAVHSAKFQGGQTEVTLQLTPAPERIDAFTVYSASTRARTATLVYLNEETHGEQAKANVARALNAQRLPRSAQSLDLRDIAPGPTSAISVIASTQDERSNRRDPNEFTKRAVDRVKVENARGGARLAALRPVFGRVEVTRIRRSTGWNQLTTKLDALDARGLDDCAMLKRAARMGELVKGPDPAQVLAQRLDRVKPQRHSRSEPVGLKPSAPWLKAQRLGLVGPADRGPQKAPPPRRQEGQEWSNESAASPTPVGPPPPPSQQVRGRLPETLAVRQPSGPPPPRQERQGRRNESPAAWVPVGQPPPPSQQRQGPKESPAARAERARTDSYERLQQAAAQRERAAKRDIGGNELGLGL